MNVAEMFAAMEQNKPYEQYSDSMGEPQYVDPYHLVQQNWEHRYTDMSHRQSVPMLDGYISSNPMDNWGGPTLFAQKLEEQYNTSNMVDKLDPNRIFNSDIAALNTQATDQIRINKIFENRLRESLTEKGKFGLTETDIMAMQALTSAKSAVVNIAKEKVAIKKSIADLRLKQLQQQNNGSSNVLTGPGGRSTQSATDIGRSIMDEIFNDPNGQRVPESAFNYDTISPDQAADLLDNTSNTTVDIYTMNEHLQPKTIVKMDKDGNTHYETYSSSGERLSDELNSRIPINPDTIDRQTNKVQNMIGMTYDIEPVDEPTKSE